MWNFVKHKNDLDAATGKVQLINRSTQLMNSLNSPLTSYDTADVSIQGLTCG